MTQDLENSCWELLWPLIEPMLRVAPKQLEEVQVRPYRCWVHEINEKEPNRLRLHFANSYQPRSPFKHCRRELIETLYRLLAHAHASHPEVTLISCGSWLGQFPPFLSLFPAAWRLSFRPRYDAWGTYGWWGQYMTHEGRFHWRNGDLFRLHHRHPYTAGSVECGIIDGIAHLEQIANA